MKYTKRELILLFILVIILSAGGFYKFVIVRQEASINALKSKEAALKLQADNAKNEITSKSRMDSDLKILKAKAEDKSLPFFPSITQEKIILIMDDIIKKSGIDAESMSFTEPKNSPMQTNANTAASNNTSGSNNQNKANNNLKALVDEYNGVKAEQSPKKTVNNAKKDNSTADNMELSLAFKGNYSDLLSMIKDIEGFSKKIIIKNVNIASGESGAITGVITLDFYAIPKIDASDENYFPWSLDGTYGKSDPFYSAVAAEATPSTASADSSQKYDFLMSVKPISSDFPTIMLGKTDDSTKNTYVYADNSGVENVDIYFTQQDGKYLYKYRTSRDSYPQDFNTKGEEFTPIGDSITLGILTDKRNSSSDIAGANIRIYNQTDKAVNVTVEGDDSSRPRVKVSGQGSVSVKSN